jgi:hypothetical protein
MGLNWKIDIRKVWQDPLSGDIKAHCFAYHVPRPAYPPYPGHAAIEEWLDKTGLSKAYERTMILSSGESVLEVTFKDARSASLFFLLWS